MPFLWPRMNVAAMPETVNAGRTSIDRWIALAFAWIIVFDMFPAALAVPPGELGLSRHVWFALRTDGRPGDGTLTEPFNGANYGLDAKLGEFSSQRITNLNVHILPGIYDTRGSAAWTPRSGWKIHGAGMDVTTLRLIGDATVRAIIATFHWDTQFNIEISDLTLDCNYSKTNQVIYANAINMAGGNHAIRRVKAIHAYGVFPAFENFVIGISSGWTGEAGINSRGNVIEQCEVSGFRGTYCTAIGLGGLPVSSNRFISGIVRENKVYDLTNASGPRSLIAYGGGGVRSAVFQNNYAHGCVMGVNFDSGDTSDITIQGNQFLACSYSGISFFGQVLENIAIEDNLIEINPNTPSWAIGIEDSRGSSKVRNISIRDNRIRASNGRAGLTGGLYISAVKGETVHIQGNRVDTGLRSLIYGPKIVCFDNTDQFGRPLNLTPGYEGNQVNLPPGERGTLLLNKGTAHIMVETTSDPAANGASLLRAYARARTMQPNGMALSRTNRASVLLWPGTYAVEDSALVLDTPFVDLAGVGAPGATRLESSGNVVTQTADDVQLENLALHCYSTAPVNFSVNDKAAYFPADGLRNTTIKNCVFSSANNGWSMRLGVNFAGTYEECAAGARSWGGPGIFSGKAIDCSAGDFSFGSGGGFQGEATGCRAGIASFGAGAFHGLAKDCTAGHGSFGGSGMMTRCQVLGAINPTIPTTGKLVDCEIGPPEDDSAAVVVGEGATLYNCTLLARTGFSIDARSLVNARITQCRLNRGIRNVNNIVRNALNVEDPTLD
jgi:hypothetical protein